MQTREVKIFHSLCDVCVCSHCVCEQSALLRAQCGKVHHIVGLAAFCVGALFSSHHMGVCYKIVVMARVCECSWLSQT